MSINFRYAATRDVEGILSLQSKYQSDVVGKDDRKNGFLTTVLTDEQLIELIEYEKGLFIAELNEEVVGYSMSASWEYWSKWPLLKYMMENLPNEQFFGVNLTASNSYQYGPVCVSSHMRGRGISNKLYDIALDKMSDRYQIQVGFINMDNKKSFHVHVHKLGMNVIKEFTFNQNHYYMLARKTKLTVSA